MTTLEIGDELEVRTAIDYEGNKVAEGARVRVGAIVTEFLEPTVTLVVLAGTAPESVVLPKHVVMMHCRPVP